MVLLPYQPLLLTLFPAVPFHDWSVTGEKHAPANRRYLFIYFCLRVSFFFFLFYLGYFYSVTVGSETSGPSPHRRTAGVLSETCVFLCGFLSVCPSFSLSFFAFCFFFSLFHLSPSEAKERQASTWKPRCVWIEVALGQYLECKTGEDDAIISLAFLLVDESSCNFI